MSQFKLSGESWFVEHGINVSVTEECVNLDLSKCSLSSEQQQCIKRYSNLCVLAYAIHLIDSKGEMPD